MAFVCKLHSTTTRRKERPIARQDSQPSVPPLLYFQQVTIWWTKISRGMPQAAMRARLPQSYPLAASEIKALGSHGGIHLVTLREEKAFVPSIEVRPLPDQTRIPVGAVTVERNATGVHLHYRYTPMTGAPDRSHRPPIEFDVPVGQRARVAYNGRFSGYSIEWLYKLTVITLAVGIPPSTDLFTVAPDHSVEDLAELF